VAIDARAPLYDGGICTRIDCVSLGVVVNRDAERFYDEGEDFWPKRYAIWGRLVAQPGQIAFCIIDSECHRPLHAAGVPRRARPIRCRNSPASSASTKRFMQTLGLQRRLPPGHLRPHGAGRLPHRRPVSPAKTHWARPIETAAVLRLRAQARHHLHLSRPEDRRDGRGALQGRAQRQPVWPAR
jgi:tricarballylate dehydrogenase